jgi:trans-aconitate 2-methyltransferase
MRWDPKQYGRFADERGRPFADLIERIGAAAPRRVVDLGCGPGTLTQLLATRWPQAEVVGFDSSPEMIAQAQALGDSRIHFELGDIASWRPGPFDDVVVSNAALQWVPGHASLLSSWTDALPADAWLAWQVPGNFSAPSHVLMRSLAESPRWSALLGQALRHGDAVGSPAEYATLLLSAGCSADVWETSYTHVLLGADPVLEWVRGTGLRPVLAILDGPDQAEFEAEYATQLRAAYPETSHGTLLAYRRIFAVGHKP